LTQKSSKRGRRFQIAFKLKTKELDDNSDVLKLSLASGSKKREGSGQTLVQLVLTPSIQKLVTPGLNLTLIPFLFCASLGFLLLLSWAYFVRARERLFAQSVCSLLEEELPPGKAGNTRSLLEGASDGGR